MKTKSLFLIVLAALLMAACGGTSEPETVVSEPAQVEEEPVVVEIEPVEETVEETEPVVVEEPVVSSGTTDYTSPEDIFTLEIPAGWSQSEDTGTIEDTIIQTFTAPDGHAFVTVLVNEIGMETSAVEKAQYTQDYMRRLCGDDIRYATDVTLDDGREKMEWWSDDNKTSGTVYFDTVDNYLFFYNVYYEDAYEDTYKSTLEDVADSFSYK